jgi:hypothetical protein
MQALYQDAMAIVRKLGKPDFFITMTCNPKWTEITRELLPGQTAQDRFALCCRVFHIKLKALLDMIVKGEIFGKVKGRVYVVEFQERGLPHAHMLWIMDDEYKARTPEEIDRIVCAEIPDPNEDKELYDIVASHTMHGPCGPLNTRPRAQRTMVYARRSFQRRSHWKPRLQTTATRTTDVATTVEVS